jgi:hypothetical protein
MFRRCVAAALDGVDVRLLVPRATDIPGMRALSRAGFRPLLEAGVRVFEWNGSMLHRQDGGLDGHWARGRLDQSQSRQLDCQLGARHRRREPPFWAGDGAALSRRPREVDRDRPDRWVEDPATSPSVPAPSATRDLRRRIGSGRVDPGGGRSAPPWTGRHGGDHQSPGTWPGGGP